MNKLIQKLLLSALCLILISGSMQAQRKVEKLGRGVVAINKGEGSVYVSWRLHASDPEDIAFNVYRKNGSTTTKLNSDPITTTTGFTDNSASTASANVYFVNPVIGGIEQAASGSFSVAGSATGKSYISLPLHQPLSNHSVQHVYVGDLNGDGEFDYVVKLQPSSPYGNVFLDAYLNNGSFLWRIDLGRNMEQGAPTHNPFVMVYDFDSDGKAEVFTRTAENTTFSDGTTIGDANADGVTDYRTFPPQSAMGYMLLKDNCPEYISMVDGMTGKEIYRRDWIDRGPKANWTTLWGDAYGHRMNMNFVGVAYLDGVHPSILTSRGGGGEMEIEAYDYSNKTITSRWTWSARTNDAKPVGKTWRQFHDDWVTGGSVYSGIPSGYHWADFHNIRIADLDGDGKDEISWGVNAMNDNGTPLYFAKSDVGHGDRFQISDLNPDRPGLECYAIQQTGTVMAVLYDAGTGERLKTWSSADPFDVSRGDAGDVDPRYTGSELWSFAHSTLIQSNGNAIPGSGYPYPSVNIWWDGDLMRENLHAADGNGYNTFIQKWHYETNSSWNIIKLYNEGGAYSTKVPYGCRPALYADVMGDWREEVFGMSGDSTEIRIFSTSTPSDSRIYCLMENPEYRTCANIKGYQTSTQVDYYLGSGMTSPPMPPILNVKSVWKGGLNSNTWDIAATANWTVNGNSGTYADGDSVMFDISGATNSNVNFTSALNPAWVVVNSPIDYNFSGTGSIAGTAALLKSGKGSLSISSNATYSGKTRIDQGALYVNTNLTNSAVFIKREAYIGGTGIISQSVSFEPGSGIAPGAKNAVGTLTFAKDVTLPAKSKIKIDFSTTACDNFVVNGNFTISDTCNIAVTKLSGIITAGVYPLISYSGTFSGSLSKIGVTGIVGQKYILSNANNVIYLTIQDPRAAATAYWTGATDKIWDFLNTENWQVKGLADMFSKNDTVVFDATGNAQPIITLNGTLPVNKMIVNGTTNYSLVGSGEITGTGGLYKSGTGNLTISGVHSYTGAINISGGTFTIGSLANAGGNSSLGASALTASANITLDNTKLIYNGTEETFTDRGFTLTGNDTIHNTSAALSLTGVIVGSGKLVKTGTGTMMLKNGVNTFSGGVTIKEGRISLGDDNGNISGLGTGLLTLEGGAFSMFDSESYTTFNKNILVPAGATTSFITDSRCDLTGALTGAGTLNMYLSPLGNYGAIRTYLKGNWAFFSGTINATTSSLGGQFLINNSYGYANTSLNLGNLVTALHATSGTAVSVGEVSGVIGSYMSNTAWTIGAKNTNATFAGIISGNSITKIGTGIWTLSGVNTYGGNTTVNGGTLNITGSITGSGAVAVNTGATLSGTGSLAGVVTISGGGIVSPGNATVANSIGRLTVSNTISLAAGSTIQMQINKTTGSKDRLASTGAIKLGGTLALSLTGTFAAADTFRLFVGSSITGAFSTITPGNPGTGLSWDTTQLRSAGILAVKGKQVITFNPIPTQFIGGSDYDPAAVVIPTGATVTYTSGNIDVATIVGGKIHAVASGSAVITATVSGIPYYRDTTATQSVDVSTLTAQVLTFDAVASKTYGDEAFAVNATSDKALTSITYSIESGANVLSLTGNTVTILKAGTAKIKAYQAGDATYAPANTWITITVNKAPILVTANNQNITYGQTPTYTYQMTGFGYSETSSVISGNPTCSAANIKAGSRTITIGAGTLASDNYTFSFTNGTLTVDSATLTIVPVNKTITYGASIPTYDYTATGFVNGETAISALSGKPVYSVDGYNAGNHVISVKKGTLDASNYRFVFSNGTLTVNKATIDVTANDKVITYGDAIPLYTYNLAGFINGDDSTVISGKPEITAGTNLEASNYSIVITKGTLAAINYDFNFWNGYLTVAKAPLAVKANDQTITYGENPTLTYAISGFVNGDDLSDVDGNPTISADTISGGVHSIQISAGSMSSLNYNFDEVDGVLTVNKAKLKVTVRDTSKLERVANPTFEIRYEGFVNTDNEDSLDVKPTVECAATDSSAATTYPIVLTGGFDKDYEFIYTNGTLTVIPQTAVSSAKGIEVLYYPNPVHDQLNVSIKGNFKPVTFEVYNSNGVLVQMVESQKEITTIDMSRLSSGVYSIKVITALNVFTQQVVKR